MVLMAGRRPVGISEGDSEVLLMAGRRPVGISEGDSEISAPCAAK